MDKKKTVYYVDNKKFTEEFRKYHERVKVVRQQLDADGIKDKQTRLKALRLPVGNYIGDCFWKLANKLASRGNFSGYSFRDEMISDALESMVANAHHFNPDAETRSGAPNAFGYFTRIAWQTMVNKIKTEAKQEYIRYKVLQNHILDGSLEISGGESVQDSRSGIDIDSDYYVKLAEKYDKPKKEKKVRKGIEKFVDG
jgi:hypothetical protein